MASSARRASFTLFLSGIIWLVLFLLVMYMSTDSPRGRIMQLVQLSKDETTNKKPKKRYNVLPFDLLLLFQAKVTFFIWK